MFSRCQFNFRINSMKRILTLLLFFFFLSHIVAPNLYLSFYRFFRETSKFEEILILKVPKISTDLTEGDKVMKIQNLKTKVIGPALLLIPLACMHLGDGHHTGDPHFSIDQPSFQSSVHETIAGGMVGHGWMTIRQDSPEER